MIIYSISGHGASQHTGSLPGEFMVCLPKRDGKPFQHASSKKIREEFPEKSEAYTGFREADITYPWIFTVLRTERKMAGPFRESFARRN